MTRNKLRLSVSIIGISIIEIIFLLGSVFHKIIYSTGFALILWYRGQETDPIDVFSRPLTNIFFLVILIFISLFISTIMYNLDKETLSLKDFLPIAGWKTILKYILLFIVSFIIKLIAIYLATYLARYFLIYFFRTPQFFTVFNLLFISIVFAIIDVFTAYIKFNIICRAKCSIGFALISPKPHRYRRYIVELAKYIVFTLLYSVWIILRFNFTIYSNLTIDIVFLFFILLIFNLSMFLLFQIRKYCVTYCNESNI